MKKCYLAGPMRGYPDYNFPAFDAAKKDVETLGFHPVSPADLDRLHEGWGAVPPAEWTPTTENASEMIWRDLRALHGCDAIYLLRGWKRSTGARVEESFARFLELEIICQGDI